MEGKIVILEFMEWVKTPIGSKETKKVSEMAICARNFNEGQTVTYGVAEYVVLKVNHDLNVDKTYVQLMRKDLL